MNPDLRLRGEGDYHVHLDGTPAPPEDPQCIGGVVIRPGGENRPVVKDVYQVGAGRREHWCCSQWEQIPPDELWFIHGTMGYFFTVVLIDSLNFTNTHLELRYNLSINRDDPELEILAENERLLWLGDRELFVPFKTPHPQGYQGVWMSARLSMTVLDGLTIHVCDRFRPHHHLKGFA